jgi:hypothetical protein
MGFNLTFEPYLAPLIAILQCHIDSLRISDRLLGQCLRSLRRRIEKKCRHLGTLSDCDPISDTQHIKDIEAIYSIDNIENVRGTKVIVRWQDVPSHKATLAQASKTLEQPQQGVNLARHELLEHRTRKLDKLKRRLEFEVRSDEKRHKRVELIMRFRHSVSELYRKCSNDLKCCKRIVKKLSYRGEANVVEFRKLCDALHNVSYTDVQPQTASEVNSLIDSVWNDVVHGSDRLSSCSLLSPNLGQAISSLR